MGKMPVVPAGSYVPGAAAQTSPVSAKTLLPGTLLVHVAKAGTDVARMRAASSVDFDARLTAERVLIMAYRPHKEAPPPASARLGVAPSSGVPPGPGLAPRLA